MSEVNERTQRTSLLRGPVTDIPGLTVYLATNFLPIAGGTISGELFIASGGGLYLYDASAEADVQISVDDGSLLVGGVILLDNNSTIDASKLGVGTVPDARLSANVPLKNAASNAFTGVTHEFGTTSVATNVRINGQNSNTASKLTVTRADGSEGMFVTTSDGGTRGLWLTGPMGLYVGGSINNADGGALVTSNRLAVRGDLGVIGFATTTNPQLLNTGFSKIGAASVALGNGTVGDASGSLTLAVLNIGTGVSISRVSAGVLQIGTTSNNALGSLNLANLTASGTVQGTLLPTQFTVATLPSAAANTGRTVQVTDSSVDFPGNIGNTVAGGGANNVDVKSNGTNWRITG